MLEDGYSYSYLGTHYYRDTHSLKVLWHRYQENGVKGLLKKSYFQSTLALKKQIVLDIEENHIPLYAASIKYGPSPTRIKELLRIYRRDGLLGLERIKERGRPSGMGRPRKDSKPLTELERLQKENQELKTEIALLKKVRALVEERKARLRATGQEPSRD